MPGRFRPHPEARLLDAEGRVVAWVDRGPVLPERPAAAAIAGTMARGGGFRVGLAGDGPPEGPGFETLTSGSLGRPRRIRRGVASWMASIAVNARLFGIGPGTRVAIPGNPVQSLALYAAVEGLVLGAEVQMLDGLRPDRQRRAMVGASHIYAAPAQLRQLVEAGGPLLAARRIVTGGARLDAGLRAEIGRVAPAAEVTEFYGAAETSFITLAGAEAPPESVGRAYPGVEIEVCGPGGAVLAEGEIGEIWVRSPYVFDGYAGIDPGQARWRDGWLSVGELGRMAGDWLVLAGRAGRMVTVAGENVFPEEIEAFLLRQAGVRQAAVLARPDARRGVVLVAVLAGESAAEPAILAALRAELGPVKAPRRVLWTEGWPLLASGKTDLAALGLLL